MKEESKPAETPQTGLRTYRVTIEQPMLHSIVVEAVDQDEAEKLAYQRYREAKGIGTSQAPAPWDLDYFGMAGGEFAHMLTCEDLEPWECRKRIPRYGVFAGPRHLTGIQA